MVSHLETNLGLLQELINKDPESYKEEFLGEYNFFIKTIQLLRLQPSLNHADLQSLLELINFLASTSSHYPKEGKEYAASIMEILSSRLTGLDPEIRVAFCKALIVLRNRKIIDPMAVIDLFFTLVPCEDKNLRKFICGSMKALIKKLALQYRDQKTLWKVRTFLFTKLKDSRSVVVRTAELVLIDGFRKGFLKDAKTANALAECCLHKIPRIQVAAIRFFLGSLEDDDSDDDESGSEGEDQKTLKEVVVAYKAAKKTRKKKEKFMKAKKLLSSGKKSKKENAAKFCNLLAIRYIYDPQTFTERLFGLLESRKNEKFETRLLCMALCARMIGTHKLQSLSFYSYMHRFLQPKQREITRILLYVAQACHELVPPDIVEQLVYVIAQNFVSDRNTPEAVTVGLNTIREIFANCPFAATEDLLRDLADYKRFKNKNVSMAARAIITLFRTVNPKLLHRKDRGRPTQKLKDLKIAEFGVEHPKEFVEGAECLPMEVTPDADQMQSDESDNTDFDSDFDTEFLENDSDSNRDVDSCGNPAVTKMCTDNERSSSKDTCEMDDQKTTSSETKEKARQICEARILTQDDFRKINAFRLKQQMGCGEKRRNDDVKLEEELGEIITRHNEENGLTRLKDIEKFHKKLRKETKEERMETIRKGREGRQQFGKPKKTGAHVGRTNRELMKRKNFQMVRHKLRGKNRQRSFKERQESLRKYLLRQAGRKV